MASNRHLGRIVALQTLYEYDFRTESTGETVDWEAVMARNIDRYASEIQDKTFVRELVAGVIEHQTTLDETIQPLAPDWPIRQIERINLIILRVGLYELLHRTDHVPPKVVINEAVELAKAFGSDNSSKFINGVLGTAYRSLVEGQGSSDDAAV